MAKVPAPAERPEVPAARLQREREETRALLTDGYANDWIDQDELDRRLELAESASTVEALHALTTELRPATTALVPVRSTALATNPERLRVTFGSVERVGAWQVEKSTAVRVRFGALLLDLREAMLPDGDIELVIDVVFGSLDILVPPGWQIDNQCGALLGSVDHTARRGAPGERRVLRLRGRVVLGSLSIQTVDPRHPALGQG